MTTDLLINHLIINDDHDELINCIPKCLNIEIGTINNILLYLYRKADYIGYLIVSKLYNYISQNFVINVKVFNKLISNEYQNTHLLIHEYFLELKYENILQLCLGTFYLAKIKTVSYKFFDLVMLADSMEPNVYIYNTCLKYYAEFAEWTLGKINSRKLAATNDTYEILNKLVLNELIPSSLVIKFIEDQRKMLNSEYINSHFEKIY